jgi:hypothetical protein
MKTLHQSPTDPSFVQNPYPFYARARDQGDLHFWADYNMVAAFSHRSVHAFLRNRRFGREIPPEMAGPGPAHLADFLALEAHSLLDAEPPRHTRLRALILRAFTLRRINAMAPDIAALCHQQIDAFPARPFDLLGAYCTQVPIIVITRLLGVPETMAPQLLAWSHAMVAMYQAGCARPTEDAAARATPMRRRPCLAMPSSAAIGWRCCWGPPTAIRRAGMPPTASAPPALSGPAPPLAADCISVSARRWRGWKCASPCRSCSRAAPVWRWRQRRNLATATIFTASAACW